MKQAEALSSLKLAPPLVPSPRVQIGSAFSPGAVVRKPAEGIYSETLPPHQGQDADRLQAALLARRHPRPLSLMPFLSDWYVRMVEWFGRLWFNCLSMLGGPR
jgi:hypothetical protein